MTNISSNDKTLRHHNDSIESAKKDTHKQIVIDHLQCPLKFRKTKNIDGQFFLVASYLNN
jgi:hypothetical protein